MGVLERCDGGTESRRDRRRVEEDRWGGTRGRLLPTGFELKRGLVRVGGSVKGRKENMK